MTGALANSGELYGCPAYLRESKCRSTKLDDMLTARENLENTGNDLVWGSGKSSYPKPCYTDTYHYHMSIRPIFRVGVTKDP